MVIYAILKIEPKSISQDATKPEVTGTATATRPAATGAAATDAAAALAAPRPAAADAGTGRHVARSRGTDAQRTAAGGLSELLPISKAQHEALAQRALKVALRPVSERPGGSTPSLPVPPPLPMRQWASPNPVLLGAGPARGTSKPPHAGRNADLDQYAAVAPNRTLS